MGMNNWGSITEYMYQRPRAVFGNKKDHTISSEQLATSKLDVEEDRIEQVKKRQLVQTLLVWYVIPLLIILGAFLKE